MPLNEAHIDEFSQDIELQIKSGVCIMPIFNMTLVPEGIPTIDKASIFCAIYEKYKELNALSELPFFPSAPQNYSTSLGEESAFVGIVQVMLRELSAVYDVFSAVELNGIYDEATESAIRELQRASGLPISGELDRATYNRLLNDFYAHSYF